MVALCHLSWARRRQPCPTRTPKASALNRSSVHHAWRCRYSGADLENVCREAALKALRESLAAPAVAQSHFEAALSATRPSLTPDVLEQYRK